MRKIALVVAMCGTTLASGLSTVAYADTIPEPLAQAPDQTTLAEMQSQCDIVAQGFDTANGDKVTADVVLGDAAKVSGPTEVTGTRDVLEETIQHAGTYVPATLEIRGNPFRIGGSVNMFGDQWSTAGYWTDSTYNYTAEFASTFRHAFQCQVKRAVYHAATVVHHEAQGLYIIDPALAGTPQANAALNACNAFNAAHANGADQGFWGDSPHGNCIFDGTQAYDETIPEYWDAPVNEQLVAGTPVDQDQTDNLVAFEDHGGPVQTTGAYHVGQVVICISPNKPTATSSWRLQNGYTGDKCTTTWFKSAPWGAGTEGSNGTYISVPNYSL